tara:strand:- start:247 stop:999 length:753 start_codon:yes stop_codon:yes gene_type:complete
MALFGDVGKFFGLPDTKTSVTLGASALGFNPAKAAVLGNVAGGASEFISSLGGSDVSTAPASAGVDSGATLSDVSQTGQLGPKNINIRTDVGRGQGLDAASLGFLAPLLTGAGRALTSGAGRNIALGVGGTAIGGALTMMDGSGRKLIITRKMQREVKEMFMFMGGDLNATAQAYSNFKMRSYTADNILAIMLKKFSSQGPFVTKAAVRKTRSTLRKMKTLADMTSDLMPRKAPVRRRASTTTTKLVRNG